MNNTSIHKKQNSLVSLIRNRLFFAISLVILALLFSFLVSIYDSNSQYNLSGQKVALQGMQNDILVAMLNQETGLRGYIASNDPVLLEPFNSGRQQYLLLVQNLKELVRGSDFGATNTARAQVEARANDWYNNYAVVQIKNMRSGKLAEARSQTSVAAGKTLFDMFRVSVAQLQQAVDHDLNSIQLRMNTIHLVTLIIALVLSGAAIFVLSFTFIRFVNVLLEELKQLKTATNELGSGNLAARVQVLTHDELNELGQIFNKMAEDLQQQQINLNERDILEIVLELNAILASSPDFETLTQVFLNKVLTLNDLQIVALYLYEPEPELLRLEATQGLDYSEVQQEFKLGEGSIGRVALNRQPVQLNRPASDEVEGFKVKTMLGTVLPAGFYHVPLLHGNELLGVLAIGSIYTMNEKARNVINVVAGILAVAISNSKELTTRSHEQERLNIELRLQSSERQREELTQLNSALEEAIRARSQFHSTMSHELRTPLASIIGFSQILLDNAEKDNLSQRHKSNLERILKNSHHLLTLINDVLDLAKIEAGHMGINYAQVDVKELLTEVVEETQSIALARNLVLRVEVEEGIGTLVSDPMKIHQILLNLVSNALKFTEQGEVIVSATREFSPGQEAERIAIAVRDSGIGITPEIQKHIFEAFYQVDGSHTRKVGGTGLGLSIVSQLAALLGGTITVKSTAGQGSTFTLILPLKVAHAHVEQEAPRLHSAPQVEISPLLPSSEELPPALLRELFAISAQREASDGQPNLILVVDDNPDAIALVKDALQDTSYTVVGVPDSSKVMELVQKMHPCAITLDVMMPDLNGWQILNQLKANPATASIPVVMITILSEQSTGYVLGADDYLIKPFKNDVLLSSLQRLVITKQISSQSDQRETQQV
jgi:two-component system, chemotaxis family, sensor kinase CheA